MSKKKLLCVDCPQNDKCPTYKIVENTLDAKKVHHKLSLSMEFIFTTHNPKDFPEDFHNEVALDIAEQAGALATFIADSIEEFECEVQPMGADMSIAVISNKQAFDELSEYIKVTHEQIGND